MINIPYKIDVVGVHRSTSIKRQRLLATSEADNDHENYHRLIILMIAIKCQYFDRRSIVVKIRITTFYLWWLVVSAMTLYTQENSIWEKWRWPWRRIFVCLNFDAHILCCTVFNSADSQQHIIYGIMNIVIILWMYTDWFVQRNMNDASIKSHWSYHVGGTTGEL